MKPYKKLRLKLFEEGKKAKDLSKLLDRSSYYISAIMTAKQGHYFKENEIYTIMDFINEPMEKMGEYFNPNQRKGIA